MAEIKHQIDEMYGALLSAFVSARQFDTPLHTETVKDMAKHLVCEGFGKQNQWVPVSERMPHPHILVLCRWERFENVGRYGFATYQHDDVWYVSNEGMPKVTHWMPLPEPPEVKHE